MTTNTQYDPSKDIKLITKLSAKWAHPSGFTLEKLEVGSNGAVTTETSLIGVAPGLKFEFKGNDSNKGDLSFKYSLPVATITGDLDALNFAKTSASVVAGLKDINAGVSASFNIAKTSLETVDAGIAYRIPTLLSAYIGSSKTFSQFTAMASYTASEEITVAGQADYAKSFSGVLGVLYKCNPATTLKLKASNSGVLSASVKQAIDKKCSVVGSAEIPADFSSVKFGVNATLG